MADPNAVLTLNDLKERRNTIKPHIIEVVGNTRDELGQVELNCRSNMLESYFSRLCATHSLIEESEPSNISRSDSERLYITAKTLIEAKLQRFQSAFALPTSAPEDSSRLNCLASTCQSNRLPWLELPKFNGQHSAYTVFTRLVDDDPSLLIIDKFNYLINCLCWLAFAVVNSFQITEANYLKALQHLKLRFDNKTLIFSETIRNLFATQIISDENGVEMRQIIDSISAIRSSLLSLGTSTEVMGAHLFKAECTRAIKRSKRICALSELSSE